MMAGFKKIIFLGLLVLGSHKVYSQGFTGPYSPGNWSYTGIGFYDIFWIPDEPTYPIFYTMDEIEFSVVFPSYCGPFNLSSNWGWDTGPDPVTDFEIYYRVNNGPNVIMDPLTSTIGPIAINPLDTITFGLARIAPPSGQTIYAALFDFQVQNNDTTPPVSLVPNNITLPANMDCYAEHNYLPDSISYSSLFADTDCGTYTVTQLEGLSPWDNFPIGTTMNVFQAVDGNGHVVVDSFYVTVIDTGLIIPVIADLPLIYGSCHAYVTDTPTAIENCTGVPLTATTNDPLEYHEGGIHTITWTYEGSQLNIFTQTQTVVIIEGCVGIESTNINPLTIYPNPSRGNFQVMFSSPFNSSTHIRLVDIVGRTVYTTLLQQDQQYIDLSYLPAATYYLITTYDQQVFTQPLIIHH